MGFVKCSPSVKYCFAMWNALRRVRGFISFSFRVSEKFHIDWRSLFHIRRIFHFTIHPFCWIIRIREGGDCMSESKVWDFSADFAVRIKSYAKQSTVIIKRHISVFFSQNKYTWKQQTGQPLRSPGSDWRQSPQASRGFCFFFLIGCIKNGIIRQQVKEQLQW